MYAIIENGSKQYKVAVDDVVKFEKLNAKVGDKVYSFPTKTALRRRRKPQST